MFGIRKVEAAGMARYSEQTRPEKSPVWTYQIKILLGTLAALIVADGIISKYLIENSLALEGNPFLQDHIGRDTFLYIKVLGAVLATSLLWFVFQRRPRLTFVATLCFVVLYMIIVGWSLWIFLLFHFLQFVPL